MQIIHLIHYAMIHNTNYTELHCHCSWFYCETLWIKEIKSQSKRFYTPWPNNQEFLPFPSPPFPSTIQFIPFNSLSKNSVSSNLSRVRDYTAIQEVRWPRYRSHFISCFEVRSKEIEGKSSYKQIEVQQIGGDSSVRAWGRNRLGFTSPHSRWRKELRLHYT